MSDGPDAAVHHIRGGYHVRTGPRMGNSRPGNKIHRGIIINVCTGKYTAMTVACITAQTDIRDQVNFIRIAGFQKL